MAAENTTSTHSLGITGSDAHSDTINLFLEAALLCLLVLVVLSVGGAMKRAKFHYFGETALCMLTGLTTGLLFMWFTHSSANSGILDKDIQLSADFFYMVLLPPIIFEAGFTLQRMTFFKNILLILSLAFIGGFYSCVFVSGIMWISTRFLSYKLSMVESLVFGSLISSTDPVTILAMLPASVDKRLYMLIFGESALNDAVAIILYRFFTSLADPDIELGFGAFLTSVLSSVGVFTGSFAVGVAVALAFALLTKKVRMPDGSVYELAMLLIFAYMSYVVAELCHLTGIISIFFCGAAMSHYAYNNLSEVTILSAKMTLRTISAICDAFIFLYLGLGLVAFGDDRTHYDAGYIVCSFIAILIARTHIFFICGTNNIMHPENHIPLNHMIVMWWGGLRGAVAFALGVQFLDNEFFSMRTRSLLFGTTLITVFITVVGLGGLTPLVLKKLGLDGNSEWKEVESPTADEKGGEDDIEELIKDNQESPSEEGSKGLFFWLHKLDAKYLRPFLSHEQSARARRLGLATKEDEIEQADDAIATVTLPGALAGIVKQDSLRDMEVAAGRLGSMESVRRDSQPRRGSLRRDSSRNEKAGGVGGGNFKTEKDDGFEEIQMSAPQNKET